MLNELAWKLLSYIFEHIIDIGRRLHCDCLKSELCLLLPYCDSFRRSRPARGDTGKYLCTTIYNCHKLQLFPIGERNLHNCFAGHCIKIVVQDTGLESENVNNISPLVT